MTEMVITQQLINNLLRDLTSAYHTFDSSIAMIRFGSSLRTLPENNIDVDILLLSTKSYFKREIKEQIKRLRNDLINGESASGFNTNINAFENITNHVISQRKPVNTQIIPKFIFGPYDYIENHSCQLKIYLHFKGPITEDEFGFFCRQLPFHGKSILRDLEMVNCNFNIHSDLAENFITHKELIKFNTGLYKRVLNSDNPFDVMKCLNKIYLNCQIYNESIETKQRKTLPLELHQNSNTIGDISRGLLHCKELFYQRYQLLSELLTKTNDVY